MTAAGFKAHIRERIASAAQLYVKDLEALNDQQLGASPQGSARTAYDFSHEVAVVNQRIASRLRGEDPGPWPFGESWATASPELRSQAAIISHVRKSADQLLAAWDALPEEDLNKTFQNTSGGTNDMAEIASMAATHMVYHGGQLNYIQACYGDDKVHWD